MLFSVFNEFVDTCILPSPNQERSLRFKTGMHTHLHRLQIFNRAQFEPCRRRKHALGSFWVVVVWTCNEQNIPPWNIFSLLLYFIFSVDSAVNHNIKKYAFGWSWWKSFVFLKYNKHNTVSKSLCLAGFGHVWQTAGATPDSSWCSH